MNRKTKTIIVSAIAIPIALGSVASAAAMGPLFGSSYQEGFAHVEAGEKQRYHSIAFGKELRNAIDTNDFSAFQSLVSELPNDAPMKSFGQTEFTKLREMHTLFVEGKQEEAKAIAKTLNIHPPHEQNKQNMRSGKRAMHAKHIFRKELRSLDADAREAARAAWETGDYAAFRAAIGDALLPNVTKEVFTLMHEMKAAHDAGNRELVQELRAQLKALRS